MIEASSRSAAEHSSACLVHTLIKLGSAHVPVLIVVVCRACHNLGVGGAD